MHYFQRTAVSDRTVTFAPLPINDNSALSLECIAYFVVADSISAGLSVFVSVSFAVFSKFALLTLANLEKGYFGFIR